MDKAYTLLNDEEKSLLKDYKDSSFPAPIYPPINEHSALNTSLKPELSGKEKLMDESWLSVGDFLKLFPTIVACLLYMISLIGCHDSQFVCLEKYPLRILKYVALLIAASSLLFCLQIFLYIKKKSSIYIVMISLASLFFLTFIYDVGSDLKSHGSYNRIILFFFMIFFTVLYLAGLGAYKLLRRFPIPFVLLTVALVYCINYRIKKIYENSCYNWSQGFSNTVIDNSEGICKIYPPQTCYFEIFHGVFDFSKVFGETCENMPNNNPRNTLDFISDKTAKIIGFPRTEKFKFFPDSQYLIIQKTVAKNIINMEDKSISKAIRDETEVTINYYKNPPEASIELKYNQTLVEERRKLFNKNKNTPLVKNVLYVFIDSLSRTNFRRKLPRLYSFLESKHYKLNTNGQSKTESFQFLKYHGVGRYTGINMVPTFLGVFNIFYNGYHFIRDYKERGFITGQSLTFCGREVFDLDKGAIEKMKWDSHDHEMTSLFCDGNFTPLLGSTYPILTGTNAIRRRCLYGNSALSYSLLYAKQFFDKYANEPKFFKLGLTEAHEGSNEVIKYSDDELFNFFQEFEKKGYLNSTLVYFQSDHGLAMLGPYSALQLEDWEHESVLPSFFMLVPTSMKYYQDIRQNLIHNENSIVTPFNIYNTLKATLNNNNNKISYSMMNDDDILTYSIPRSFDCKRAFYLEEYYQDWEYLCRCKN